MSADGRWDVARQGANVAGALFQVGATAALGAAIQDEVDGGTPLIEPAGYAFAIWALIFALSLAYAVYQALPSNRENPLLRRIGWFTAGAFFFTGSWSLAVPAGLLLVALVALAGAFACLLVSYLRLARSDRGTLSSADRWLVALPLGPFLGWLTAANVVSLDSEIVRLGPLDAGGPGEALLGSALLLFGGILAALVVLAGKAGGPPQGYLAYAAAVLWALVAIVVNQYDVSLLTTGSATVASVPVALALFGSHPSRPLGTSASRRRPAG